MKMSLQQLITVLLSTITLLVSQEIKAPADQLLPQTLSASGGLLYITPQYEAPYTGTLKISANNLESPIPFYALGGERQIFGLNAPPTGTLLYVLLLPPVTVALATSAVSTLTLSFPTALSTAQPLELYYTQFSTPSGRATPSPANWAKPISGSRFKSVVTFQIPAFSLPPSTVLIFELTQ